MTTVLIASDLDRTLIYSRSALGLGGITGAEAEPGPPLLCVESRSGVEVSYLTAAAGKLLTDLPPWAELVPFSTRTPEQLSRVRLPGPRSRYAVAANGGVLIVDGVPDPAWTARISSELGTLAPLSEVWSHLERVCDPAWTLSLRRAVELFCYAVVDRERLPGTWVDELSAWTAERGWRVSLQGRKLYLVPQTLTKAAAMAELAHRLEASLTLAAGDSLLDLDLLAGSDRGIHPAHGEIADSGWSAPHVACTGSLGAQAGEDICRWFLDLATLAE